MAQNDKKNLFCLNPISGTVYHMIVIFGTHVQKDDGFQGDKRTKNDLNDQFESATLFISGTVDHIMEIFGAQV